MYPNVVSIVVYRQLSVELESKGLELDYKIRIL